MGKRLLKKILEIKEELKKDGNTWMWSVVAIFALLFTAFLLLFNILLSEGIPS